MKRISKMFIYVIMLLFMTACSAENTVKSKTVLPAGIPEFVQESDFDKINWDRKAVEFGTNGIIGNENKSGVIGADMPSLEGQKWMWHLWGVENAKKLTVVGFHKASETAHQITKDRWTLELGGPNNNADAHIPSSVKIPDPGEWAALLYVDGKLFDILVYDINK